MTKNMKRCLWIRLGRDKVDVDYQLDQVGRGNSAKSWEKVSSPTTLLFLHSSDDLQTHLDRMANIGYLSTSTANTVPQKVIVDHQDKAPSFGPTQEEPTKTLASMMTPRRDHTLVLVENHFLGGKSTG